MSPCNSHRSNLSPCLNRPPPSWLVVACHTVHPLIVAGHGGESVWEDCQGQDLAAASETPCGHALACMHVFIGHRVGGVWTLPCCSCSVDARGHSNLLLRGVFRHSQAAFCGPRLPHRREVSESGAPRSQQWVRPIDVSAACKRALMFKHPLCQREWVYWDLCKRLRTDPQVHIDYHSPDSDLTESVVGQKAAQPTCVRDSVPQVMK